MDLFWKLSTTQINQIWKRKFLILVKLLKKKTYYNAKIIEIEKKIPSISGLATNSALIAVENKIPDVNSLVQK